MKTETSCEICGKKDWCVLGERTYNAADSKNSSIYEQKRFRILFDKWFPDKTSVTITSVVCRHCGFIIYLPRPEEQDIDSQYTYLAELGREYGQKIIEDPSSSISLRRSMDFFHYVKKYIDLTRVNTILDFGGGDGSLMYAFQKNDKQCYLVDYSERCVPGVTKLSNTLVDLHSDMKFDLIICSHVFEHLAQPLLTLKSLISHLGEGGQIFIEVPLGVWMLVPLPSEPVTHINFFTPNSLYNLLLLAGLKVMKCEITVSVFQSGNKRLGIRAIAKKENISMDFSNLRLRSPDAMSFIKPSIYKILRHRLYFPIISRHI